MPCRSNYDDYDYQALNNNVHKSTNTLENKTIENLRNELITLGKKYNYLKKDTDKLTQFLCYTCGILMDCDNMYELDNRLIKWWKDHNDWDKHRTLETFKNQFGSNPDQRPTKDAAFEWFVKQAEDVHPLSDYHKYVFFHDVWEEFVSWFDGRKSRANRIAELESELARLKAES